MSVNFILVHIHRKYFPEYIYTCIEQIKITNKESEIFLAFYSSCEKIDYDRLSAAGCHLIDLKKHLWSMLHFRFKLKNRGIFTTERFFVIYEVMKYYNLKDVIHVENDVMVYANVNRFMEVLKENYDLGFVRESDKRCIASFVYIKDSKFLRPLIKHFLHAKNVNDMDDISKYGFQAGLRYLPVVTELYTKKEKMTTLSLLDNAEKKQILVADPSIYCENVEKFGCVFDAGAYGLYIGGVDKKLGWGNTVGYISPISSYNNKNVAIKWEIVDGKRVPFYIYEEEKVLIANLHIHSKELEKYRSDTL